MNHSALVNMPLLSSFEVQPNQHLKGGYILVCIFILIIIYLSGGPKNKIFFFVFPI